MMKPVIQEDSTGCGLASVATLAGVTYQHVKTVAGQLGIDVQDPQLWSDTTYVRKLLAHYGLSASRKTTTFKSWGNLPPRALLAIKWHKRNACAFWHWVVFYRGPQGPVVMDPKREPLTHCRTDFGRLKPKWFLTLTIPQSNDVD
jgi:ABC-type bacteriocin/lantibiotic exporter with double-glycine peptidase domain